MIWTDDIGYESAFRSPSSATQESSNISHVLKSLARRALFLSKNSATKILPPRALDAYLSALGSADYYFGRDMRDRCRPLLTDHLKHPPGSEFYEFYVSQLCRNLVRWSIPHAHPYWTKRSRRLEMVGEQHVRRCLDEGRGVIVLLSHFGPWPFISHEFERRGLRIAPTYPLGWPHEARVDMADRIQFLREARRVLARNGIVGLMGDVGVVGVGGLGRMVELPFLGVTTPFPIGCTTLSVRTSTPIVPVFSLRHSDGRHDIVCTEPIDPGHYENIGIEQEVKMLECYAARLEEMVRAHPHNAYSYLEFAPRVTNSEARL